MGDKVKLSVLSGRPTIQEYAQGAAQDATSALADFIAPTVGVSKHVGKFKTYDTETRFKIPESTRGLGGMATILEFDRDDKDYNCEPHAYDTPLDDIEVEEAEGESLIQEATDDIAWVAGLSHERKVINLALNNAGAASGGVWNTMTNDPVKEINTSIINVIKAAGGGSVEVGIVMDPTAALAFFANTLTKSYFPGIKNVAPTVENMQSLFMGRTEARISFMVLDTAPSGKASTLNFMMSGKTLVFARSKSPTRRSPDFMKTFRLRNRWMAIGSYRSEPRRSEVIKIDWSEDAKVTNSAAAELFSLS